jgi:DNA-binding protein HU-beta
MSASKRDLVTGLANAVGCSTASAERGLHYLMGEIAKGITEDGRIDLRGLGSFTRERTEARQGRNPSTGETIQIPAGYRVKFKPGKQLRDQMPAA